MIWKLLQLLAAAGQDGKITIDEIITIVIAVTRKDTSITTK